MCAWGVGAMRSMGGRQGMPCGEWRVGVYPSRDVGWILGGGGSYITSPKSDDFEWRGTYARLPKPLSPNVNLPILRVLRSPFSQMTKPKRPPQTLSAGNNP